MRPVNCAGSVPVPRPCAIEDLAFTEEPDDAGPTGAVVPFVLSVPAVMGSSSVAAQPAPAIAAAAARDNRGTVNKRMALVLERMASSATVVELLAGRDCNACALVSGGANARNLRCDERDAKRGLDRVAAGSTSCGGPGHRRTLVAHGDTEGPLAICGRRHRRDRERVPN